jgi:hypothetical protein
MTAPPMPPCLREPSTSLENFLGALSSAFDNDHKIIRILAVGGAPGPPAFKKFIAFAT